MYLQVSLRNNCIVKGKENNKPQKSLQINERNEPLCKGTKETLEAKEHEKNL